MDHQHTDQGLDLQNDTEANRDTKEGEKEIENEREKEEETGDRREEERKREGGIKEFKMVREGAGEKEENKLSSK